MAKPILKTPELSGSDAERFVHLHNKQSITKKDKQIIESCINIYKKIEK